LVAGGTIAVAGKCRACIRRGISKVVKSDFDDNVCINVWCGKRWIGNIVELWKGSGLEARSDVANEAELSNFKAATIPNFLGNDAPL
jgi:hypothetical protein